MKRRMSLGSSGKKCYCRTLSRSPSCGTVEQGEQLHGLVVKTGDCLDLYVATALITMYSNCGDSNSTRKILEFMIDKDAESYNAMASGFLRNAVHSMALVIVRKMILGSSENPNKTTLLVVLSACASVSASSLGKEAHSYVLKRAMDCSVSIGTALVDMYSKCGSLECAYLPVFLSHGGAELGVLEYHDLRFPDT